MTAAIYDRFVRKRLDWFSDVAANKAQYLEDELEYLVEEFGEDEDLDDEEDKFEDEDDGWVLVGVEDDTEDDADEWFDGFDGQEGDAEKDAE